MAIVSSVTISGSVTGLSVGTKTFGPTTVSTTTPIAGAAATIATSTLASGANTFTVPTSSGGVLIQFDSSSVCTKTLKGVTGDTGVALTKTGTVFLAFDTTAPASFCITASAADTSCTTTLFYI